MQKRGLSKLRRQEKGFAAPDETTLTTTAIALQRRVTASGARKQGRIPL
jgi:hypothetical protein